MTSGMLTTQGSQIVNTEGQPVILRGVGLGGWMNMENFITGYPANEEAQREALYKVLGPEKYRFFFDRFLEYFFGPDDARFLASLGLNLVRIPINYRHFESDMEPFVIKEEGFRHLDRVVNLCAEQGIYTILDLHALPGYQNQDWHSDNPTHKALFWKHRHFQDRAVHLWQALAGHYRDHPWVAGYNPMNEPGDPTGELIEPFYRRLYEAIRAVDPHHIIFFDGNRYSQDFHMFHQVWPNTVFTAHDYAEPGFIHGGPYPGYTDGQYFDASVIEEVFLKRTAFMREKGSPIWIGEFGPVYRGEPEADAMRYQLLRDQLEIYRRYGASWSIWTYKDIGLQGLVYTAPDSPWNELLRPFLEKKARLGVDTWGTLDTHIRHIMQPLEEIFAREFPDYAPFPFGASWLIRRLVRHILLAEPLLEEFAALFAGLNEAELDRLLQSFRFEQCIQREPLNDILREYACR
ncbi:glycoside hydrolase family 5 protein [Thermogemmatispora tikiterensis]|uniref:Glycoside hydrolase family 5 n=1 Tax=Thermogemmatispora tikiterensis TaxID=1825093 RepID=A0A328VM88_9CHLR|nr:cellulase family glycosylhydrolase [Thermogemmatispora tikiterensis]RAQ95285.1 glycoside hydrolase family 5 [Thermogemmatispora tikiterensis]